MPSKLYLSKNWLIQNHHMRKRTLKEMAADCGVTEMTIRRAMEKHNLRIIK